VSSGLFQVNGIPLGTGREYKWFTHQKACEIQYGLGREAKTDVMNFVLTN
jgi:hypothetical protein